MSSMYKVSRQKMALDAIKSLKTYLGIQGGTDKEPLPTMSEIVEYSLKQPRLLRLSESPLSILYNHSLPPFLVHDWYEYIALEYLEDSVGSLLSQWETECKDITYDPGQFVKLVNDIQKCYDNTTLGLMLNLPCDSPFNSTSLKERVQRESIALIKELTPHFFEETVKLFYQDGLYTIELLFRAKLDSGIEFAYLFSPSIAKYKDHELELRVETILDPKFPKYVDMFFLSEDMIDYVCNQLADYDGQNNVDIDSWLGPLNTKVENHTLDLDIFSSVCDKLNVLSMAPNWRGILQEVISQRVSQPQWKKNWEVAMLPIFLKWLHVLILPWVSYVMAKSEDVNKNWLTFIQEKILAEHCLYEDIYQLRAPDVFDIMNRYPSTEDAFSDLSITTIRRDALGKLQKVLYDEMKDRLFNPGVAPTILLSQYIICIKCLSRIDPSCEVMVPIILLAENYVKHYRDDIADGAVDLIREQDEDTFQQSEGSVYVFAKSELDYRKFDIVYDDTAMLENLRKKTKDPIAMIVSLCNPIQDFVNAYCHKFAEALFKIQNYNADEEIQRLEFIKKNFPPDTFLKCDVMLKDVDESKRIDKIINESSDIDSTFHAMIVSKHYWPGVYDDEDSDEVTTGLKPLSRHESVLKEYEAEFQKYKPSRELTFMPNKGLVVVELDFESTDRKQTFHTTPEAAQIIQLFATKADRMSKKEVAIKLHMSVEESTKALQFWYDQKVIQLEVNGNFSLIED